MPFHVLVVDDEQDVLGAIERCLRLRGFEVHTATSSAAALLLCEEHTFDLLILDFIIPGIDGLELLARIRRLSPLARAIVVSGQLDRAYKQEDLERKLRETVEADAYLKKPVSCDELVSISNRLLGEDTAADWKHIATRIVAGKSSQIQKAKEVASELKAARKAGK